MRLARPAAWTTAAVSLVVLLALAAALVPWDWVPGGELTPAAAGEVFTAGQIERAEEYSSARRYLGWAAYAVSLLVVGALGFTSWGSRLVRRVGGERAWWLAVPAGVLVMLAVGRFATLPFAVLVRQRNLDFGLTEQTWPAWAVDVGKSLLVSWTLTSLVLLVLVAAARWSPRWWFAWAGAGAATLTLSVSFLYPVLLEPVFNEFTPLPDGELRSSVLALAQEQGVAVQEVLVADASRRTTTLNAYVSGFAGTRRVVLYDNLVADLPNDQASVVVAHELAHAKHHDVLVGTALGAVAGVLGVALLALLLDSPVLRRRALVEGPGDPAVVPLVLALAAVVTLLTSPVQATVSRAVEVRADREALAATGESATFVDMQRELALASLSDPTPPRWSQLWFGSHPTVLERAGLPSSLDAAGER